MLAAALALTCYWNSLQGGLVHDDIFAIRDNEDVRPDAPLSQVFSNDFWGKPMSSNVSHKSYRPLTILTFRMNYALHGLDPWGYHAVNVALHAVVTALFGWLCRRVAFAERDLVFLAMCLFASHPVHTEAVSEHFARVGGLEGGGANLRARRLITIHGIALSTTPHTGCYAYTEQYCTVSTYYLLSANASLMILWPANCLYDIPTYYIWMVL